jgi:murein DD-endopeptidase MepM/ murein hydrolase activator NlpD
MVEAAAGGFVAGAIIMGAVAWAWRVPAIARPAASGAHPADRPLEAERHDRIGRPPVVAPSPLPPVFEADPISELRDRQLEIPVQGAARTALRESFSEMRGTTHRHEAIDIMAPRNTPVLAVEDGTIARLFESNAGGTTVYQFDPATRYVYYYAHLERYADGLQGGAHVARGQVLGYVGTSGNAPREAPHLHFAIFRLTEEKQWWHGTAIDPFEVLKVGNAGL